MKSLSWQYNDKYWGNTFYLFDRGDAIGSFFFKNLLSLEGEFHCQGSTFQFKRRGSLEILQETKTIMTMSNGEIISLSTNERYSFIKNLKSWRNSEGVIVTSIQEPNMRSNGRGLISVGSDTIDMEYLLLAVFSLYLKGRAKLRTFFIAMATIISLTIYVVVMFLLI